MRQGQGRGSASRAREVAGDAWKETIETAGESWTWPVLAGQVVWVGQGNSDPGQLGVSGRFTSKGLDHWQLAWPHPSPHCGL